MHRSAALADRQRAMRERNAPVEVCELPGVAAFERHYKPSELAKLWSVGESTIMRMFRDEPGVLRLGERGALRRAVRIPQSVAERKHREMVSK